MRTDGETECLLKERAQDHVFVLPFSAATKKLSSICMYLLTSSQSRSLTPFATTIQLLANLLTPEKLSLLPRTVYCRHTIPGIISEPFNSTHPLHCNFKFLSFQLTSDISFQCLLCVDVPSVRSLRYSTIRSLQSTKFSFFL